MRNMLARTSALAIGIALVAPAEAVPNSFNHSGRLKDALGAPLTGFNSLAFSLHSAPSGGSALWAETQTVEFTDGYYSVQLGKTNPLDPAVFDDDDIYLAIAVNGGAPLPSRIKLESVPWSFNSVNADTATNVDGGVVNASEIRINGTTVIDSSGNPDVDWSDLTGIPSDFADGIDNEGSSGLPSTCAPAEIAVFDGSGWSCDDAFNHTHSADDIDGGTLSTDRLPMGASSGSVAWGDHSHGGFADASHTHSSYADTSHTHTPSGVDALSCSDGQVPVWNSSAWECGDAATGGGGGGGMLFSYELDGSAPYEDFSGGGSDLTWDGLGLTQGAAGHSGTGVNFSNGILIAPAGNSIFESPTVTVEAWVRPALPTDGDQTILQKEGAYRLIQKRGATNSLGTIEMQITSEAGDSCTVESYLTVEAGTWAHVSGAYNGRTVSVAVNDDWVEAACDKGPLAQTGGSALNIGASTSKADAYNGLIDEIRGWSNALPTSYIYGTSSAFAGSDIITPQEAVMINEWIGDRSQRWELCYKRSVDGAATSTFHSRCNNKGPSVTVATLSTGKRVGGYANVSWETRNDYHYSDKHFVFQLTDPYKYEAGARHASAGSIYDNSSYGPTFGTGHDLSLGYSSVIGNGGGDDYCNLGHGMACKVGSYGYTSCRNEFCGTYSGWTTSEVEVWVHAN